MTAWPVSTKVNPPQNDEPNLLEPVQDVPVARPPPGVKV
jgi:putative SOS response-associated peptidase YedK